MPSIIFKYGVFILLGCLAVLTSCSSAQLEKEYGKLLIPMYKPLDPSDKLVKQAMVDVLHKAGAPASSSYEFKRYDLNSDGRRDALVFLKNPYGYWCNVHGCTMVVLQAHNDHFSFVNHVQPVREPVYISTSQTNGWQDLVIRVSGRLEKAKDVILSYNGRQYPDNPELLPPSLHYAAQNDIRIFYE